MQLKFEMFIAAVKDFHRRRQELWRRRATFRYLRQVEGLISPKDGCSGGGGLLVSEDGRRGRSAVG